MTDTQLFAFVILPIVIAVAGIVIAFSSNHWAKP